jgi:hypothetical protein
MTDDLESFEITPLPESGQLRFRFQFHGQRKEVVFETPYHVGGDMVNALNHVRRQYKLAKARRNQVRARPKLRLVKRDDD